MQSFLVRQGLSLKIVRCYNRCCLFGYLKVVVFFWGGGGTKEVCMSRGPCFVLTPPRTTGKFYSFNSIYRDIYE